MSDLIVIGYPDEETAEKVWDEVVKLHENFLVDLEDAAIIRRDQKGRLLVTIPAHHAVIWGTLSRLVTGRAQRADLPVAARPGGRRGRGHHGGRARRGRESRHQGRIPAARPRHVAARHIRDHGRRPQGDAGQVHRGAEALRGMVLKTSLPHDAEQQLMKALHGGDSSAAT